MNRIAALTVAAVVLLGAAGCSAGQVPASQGSDSPSAAPAASTAPSSAPAKKTNALIVKFGEAVQYDDGLQINVRHMGTVTGSEYAAPEAARGGEVQLFEITLTNGTGNTYEPVSFFDTVVYGAAGKKAERVFDSNINVTSGYFSGVMIPGATQTITSALLVPTAELSTVVFTVQPSYKHKAAVVTGGL